VPVSGFALPSLTRAPSKPAASGPAPSRGLTYIKLAVKLPLPGEGRAVAVFSTASVGFAQFLTFTAEFSTPPTYLRRPSLGFSTHCVPFASSYTTL